jgi:AmmeMemoRadiSam system protein B
MPIGGNSPPRAIIAPHIDPLRGARVYGSAYRLLRDHPARRIVVLGVGHAGGGPPFVVTDRTLETPFGPCAVDGDFVRSLAEDLPFDPLAGGLLHQDELSIAHQALFLRRTLVGWDDRRIVPILCCFPWTSPDAGREAPERAAWIGAFARRLGGMVDGRTLVVAGVDLAHINPGYAGAPCDFDAMRRATEERDHELLEYVAAGETERFRDAMDRDANARSICGYPALLTLLDILPGSTGVVVDYGQAIDRRLGTLVSFAAVVLR